METKTNTPSYISPDTYKGRHTVSRLAAGIHPVNMTAAELAAESGEGILWESFGTPMGYKNEHFARARYIADAEGNLHVFNSEGGKTLIHPAARALRVLRKVA